ncbi:type 2 lanthipeptide synthetase LanM family protein [Actinophytocola sp.]|uniref:type 2 lanthipeptide synthetase LanM family protein n=1 Tax=Actinophytocola sp. TaxID=1872138 RepID=UPI00389B36CF
MTLPPHWWTGGLAMADRLPAPLEGGDATRTPQRWRESPGVTAWLDAADLDEGDLARLLTEPAPALSRRVGRPSWADEVSAAVEAEVGLGGGTPSPTLAAFAGPLRPFTDRVAARLREHAARLGDLVDVDAVRATFAEDLADRLVHLAARTLVLELNVARVSGRLTGATGRDRFADFLRRTATAAGLAALFAEYPVLARLLAQTCEHTIAAHTELLDRLAADRAAIVATLLDGTDPGPVSHLDLGRGDRHGRGRAVAVLTFADGRKIVYKPRSQDLQRHFREVVGWLNTRVPGLDLRAAASLPRDGYGWVEFIAHRPCATVGEVDRFYRRQGTLLALLYALDATDVHYENLIAAGDQPVLVDVETLFHPVIDLAVTTGPDPAQEALRTSVTRTALLPHLLVGEHGAVDLSGLGGDEGAVFPFDSIAWDASGTDEMRLVRRPGRVRAAANRPRFAGRDVDPADHSAALLTGFRAGYDAIVAGRDELLDLLRRCRDDEIRVVVRPTRAYATLLDEATHPDLLRDGLDRDRLFAVLWADSAHSTALRRLVPHETTDLWAGDVPLFHGRPGSRDLWTVTGERLPDLLPRTGLDAVIDKITAMDEVGRGDQEWLVTAAMATRGATDDHRGGPPVPGPTPTAVPDQTRLLAAAAGIADQLVGRSLQDDLRANWLGLERVDGRHWSIMPLGAGLGDGYTGVALFLAQLGELTSSRRYRDLARKALTPLPRLIDALAARPDLAQVVGPGAFAGLGGICYALARLSRLLDAPELRDWLTTAVEVLRTLDDGPAGIATGRAGGLLAMLAVHSETRTESANRAAKTFAARLAENANSTVEPAAEPFPPTGFASGPAGVAHALRRFAATTGERPAAAAEPGLDVPDLGWCTGLAGLLLAESDRLATVPGVEAAVARLADHTPLRDASLCHGELGIVEALVVLAAQGHEQAQGAVARAAARTLGALDRYGPRCGTPGGVPSPGLLTGLAGIGYGLLRLAFPREVPSVLTVGSTFPPERR